MKNHHHSQFFELSWVLLLLVVEFIPLWSESSPLSTVLNLMDLFLLLDGSQRQ
jgi:hypothetical protein